MSRVIISLLCRRSRDNDGLERNIRGKAMHCLIRLALSVHRITLCFSDVLIENIGITADGTIVSNIRAHLPGGAVVMTPRRDVMCIVTEWGAAHLHNQPLETRICAIISISIRYFAASLHKKHWNGDSFHRNKPRNLMYNNT